MSFSKRLRKLRERKGLSQEELADKLNMPRTSITHYEKSDGVRLPRQQRLYDIADFFGVSVDYLLGRSNTDYLSPDEQDFMSDSNELTIEELQEKYRLTVDGKPATEEEIKAVKAFIRSYRGMK